MKTLQTILFAVIYFLLLHFTIGMMFRILFTLPVQVLDIILKASEYEHYRQFYTLMNIFYAVFALLYLSLIIYLVYQSTRLKVYEEKPFIEALLEPIKKSAMKFPPFRRLASVYNDSSTENN